MTISPYQEIIEALIKKYIEVVGPQLALGMAREIGTLDVADDGTVRSMSGDGYSTLEALHDKYTDLLGLSSQTFSRFAVGPIVAKYKDLKIPKYLT